MVYLLRVTTLDQKMEFTHVFTQRMLLSIYHMPPLDQTRGLKTSYGSYSLLGEHRGEQRIQLTAWERSARHCASIQQMHVIQALGAPRGRAADWEPRRAILGGGAQGLEGTKQRDRHRGPMCCWSGCRTGCEQGRDWEAGAGVRGDLVRPHLCWILTHWKVTEGFQQDATVVSYIRMIFLAAEEKN